ncbi:MAG: hypothetical protein AAGA18_03490 [Verrucomicrobiota bacterium]
MRVEKMYSKVMLQEDSMFLEAKIVHESLWGHDIIRVKQGQEEMDSFHQKMTQIDPQNLDLGAQITEGKALFI